MEERDKVWHDARKLAESFINAKMKRYCLNYDDGTPTGIQVEVKKLTEDAILGEDVTGEKDD